jgi:hypothetical protein
VPKIIRTIYQVLLVLLNVRGRTSHTCFDTDFNDNQAFINDNGKRDRIGNSLAYGQAKENFFEQNTKT